MYRRDYPDIPGLFDARFRDYNRPSIVREFQNNWLISIVGIVFVACSCGLLFWNEGRAVKTAMSLEEGRREVLVPETTDVVFEEYNGKLVLVSGTLSITDPLKDATYGISINAVKLRKIVQVYQWYEVEDQRSQNLETGEHDSHPERTYSYNTDWYDYHIDSSNFANTLGHHNPHLDSWPANSTTTTNGRVKIGNYLLGTQIKEKFDEFKPFTSDERPRTEGVKIHMGLYYHSQNVWQPEVGDWRVQFSYSGRHGDEYTVVGRQTGREIRPYETETPQEIKAYHTKAGEELLILQAGLRGPQEVFNAEHNSNRTATWIYRIVGWFVMFLGLSLTNPVLELALDNQPTVKRVIVLSFASVSFSVSVSLTLLVIGSGWIWFRPLVGAAVLTVAALPYVLPVIRLVQSRRRERHHLHRP